MKKRGKRIKWLLGLGLCVGILLGGCGKKEETKMPAVDSAIADDETPEVTIIDDNGGVVVNELLEEEEDPVSAELIEEEKESEPIIPSEAKDEEKADTKTEGTVIDPVTEAEIEPEDIVVDTANLNGHQENMLMLMDSLNMCMLEMNCTYDITNTGFFWNAINYTIMTYPEVPGCDSEEMLIWADDYSSVKVHADLIKVYAEGLFADFKELPAVPAGSIVTAADTAGYYNLSVGDRGDSYGEIVTWVEKPDGSCHVEAKLVSASDDKTIVSYVYELVKNSNENGVFAYRIKSAKIKA